MSVLSLDSFKAIIFDLDSTLTETNHYPIRASELLLRRVMEDPSEILGEYVKELVKNYRMEIRRVVDGAPYKSPFYVVRDATKRTLSSLGIEIDDETINEGTEVFRNLHVELSEMAPGSLELLTKIRNLGIPLGLVTNSFEGNASIILQKFGLHLFFEAIVDGSVVRAFKPMPQPFEYAMKHLGSMAKNTMFVGDEFVADIVGGKSLNLTCIWINSRNLSLGDYLAKYGHHFAPDLVLSSLSELLELLP
ncbi:MAG: HAD family hydrolase [Candidatus Thorarchaeota archaeon]|nr:HAD family hydrolase [Candidatus Thorarchaeota archaeon]